MDIAIVFDTKTLSGDFAMSGADLLLDPGLKTAVIISLFTDRRAHDEDRLPSDPSPIAGSMLRDRRGWWGDFYAPEVLGQLTTGQKPVDRIGSRDWLLSREKQLDAVVRRAKEYGEEALQWLIDDGVAASVEVFAEISAPGVLGRQITITRPGGTRESHRFDFAWTGL